MKLRLEKLSEEDQVYIALMAGVWERLGAIALIYDPKSPKGAAIATVRRVVSQLAVGAVQDQKSS